MPQNFIIPLTNGSQKLNKFSSGVRIDEIRITAEQYLDLKILTIRRNNNADAIFSETTNHEVFASTRFGKCPKSERALIEGIGEILREIVRSMGRYRQNGGRFFVNPEGAYWKAAKGKSGDPRIRFAKWKWMNDPPESPPEIIDFNGVLEVYREWHARQRDRFGSRWDESRGRKTFH